MILDIWNWLYKGLLYMNKNCDFFRQSAMTENVPLSYFFLSDSIVLMKHFLPLSWSSLSEICQFIIWLWLELIGHGFRSILQYRDQRRRPYSDGFLSTTGRDYIAVVLRLLALWAEFLHFFQKYSAFLRSKSFFKHIKCLSKKIYFLQKYCGITCLE